ncbi:hypothetical protein ACHQM5_016348 [Ranunculus cassubicifolius]
MSILVWNCRGTGQPLTMESLKDVVSSSRPFLIFVSETKASLKAARNRILRLGQWESHIVPSVGASGGLWLLWDSNCSVNVLYSDQWIIHAEITDLNGNMFIFSGIYGHSKYEIRSLQWNAFPCFMPDNDEPNRDVKRSL